MLSWITSYVSDRFHYISINSHPSSSAKVYISTAIADDTLVYVCMKAVTPVILSTLTDGLTKIKTLMNNNSSNSSTVKWNPTFFVP